MSRTYTVVIPDPDDATNGIVDNVTIHLTRRDGVNSVAVDYPSDPNGTDSFPLSTLAPADRLKVRDAALAILAAYKARRNYV